jgi:hypothetical protein
MIGRHLIPITGPITGRGDRKNPARWCASTCSGYTCTCNLLCLHLPVSCSSLMSFRVKPLSKGHNPNTLKPLQKHVAHVIQFHMYSITVLRVPVARSGKKFRSEISIERSTRNSEYPPNAPYTRISVSFWGAQAHGCSLCTILKGEHWHENKFGISPH